MHGQFHRLLRLASIGVWAVLVAPILTTIPLGPGHMAAGRVQIWIAFWLIFGIAFLIATSPRAGNLTRICALACETLTALSMTWVRPDYYVGFLLVMVAWQAAVFFSLRIAVGWVLAQAILLFFVLSPIWSDGCGWVTSAVYLAFQAFAVVAAILLRNAWEQEIEQARVQAEMATTAEILVERSRAHERLRISRDLHDALGHRLTVLSLNLEVAHNTTDPEIVAKNVSQALDAAKGAMAEVREVVGALRKIEAPDVRTALDRLAAHTGSLHVHMTSDPELRLHDIETAHALLSCVQEIITNAIKHARARNLWISVGFEGSGVMVRARDDGRGSTSGQINTSLSGFGLVGMNDRLAALGGGVEISVAQGGGFSLRARFPLHQAPSK